MNNTNGNGVDDAATYRERQFFTSSPMQYAVVFLGSNPAPKHTPIPGIPAMFGGLHALGVATFPTIMEAVSLIASYDEFFEGGSSEGSFTHAEADRSPTPSQIPVLNPDPAANEIRGMVLIARAPSLSALEVDTSKLFVSRGNPNPDRDMWNPRRTSFAMRLNILSEAFDALHKDTMALMSKRLEDEDRRADSITNGLRVNAANKQSEAVVNIAEALQKFTANSSGMAALLDSIAGCGSNFANGNAEAAPVQSAFSFDDDAHGGCDVCQNAEAPAPEAGVEDVAVTQPGEVVVVENGSVSVHHQDGTVDVAAPPPRLSPDALDEAAKAIADATSQEPTPISVASVDSRLKAVERAGVEDEPVTAVVVVKDNDLADDLAQRVADVDDSIITGIVLSVDDRATLFDSLRLVMELPNAIILDSLKMQLQMLDTQTQLLPPRSAGGVMVSKRMASAPSAVGVGAVASAIEVITKAAQVREKVVLAGLVGLLDPNTDPKPDLSGGEPQNGALADA